jgi:hypothetical protein
MRAISPYLVIVTSLSASAPFANAQVELPRSTPAATLTQQVGLTEISVEYECPAVKGRKIWGGVVPYGQVWAFGSTPGTKVKFNRDVTVGDRSVPAGTYWLVAFPSASAWTVALNKAPDATFSTRDYRPDLDVVRLKVTPKATARHERLMFSFSDLTDDRASLDLEWDALRVSIPVQVNTTQQVLSSINNLDGTWRSFANAARYMLETKKDYDAGMRYIDQALALKDDWYSMWVKGALFAAQHDFASAREWAIKAREAGRKAGNGAALAPDLEKAIAEWTRKSGSGGTVKESPALTKETGTSPPSGSGASTAPAKVEAAATEPPPAVSPVEDPPLRRARLRRK